MSFSATHLYSAQHLWVRQIEHDVWEIGISDYAQNMLGDIVFIDAPKIGAVFQANQLCGVIESVKTASDLHMPMSGEVLALNAAVLEQPELLNTHAESTWLFKVRTSEPPTSLLSSAEYQALLDDADA